MSSIRNPVLLYSKHGGAHQMFEVAPSGDDWMKLINPASGLCLQVSKNGQELTVEGGILNFTKFYCMFLNPNNFFQFGF